jgi:hypothetical protein
MDAKDKQAVEAAKNKAANQQTTRQPRTNGNGRATESAQAAGSNLQEKLTVVSDRLAQNMKKQIVAKAVVKVLEDFENGDFGELANEMFLGLDHGINAPLETEYRVLEAWQESPKFALPSAAELNG